MTKKDSTIPKLTDQDYVRETCKLCPLQCRRGPESELNQVDILIIVEKSNNKFVNFLPKNVYSTKVMFLNECVSIPEETQFKEAKNKQDKAKIYDPISNLCCIGRKLDFIQKYQPKLVICVGHTPYTALERQFGMPIPPKLDIKPIPTKYGDHTFWLMELPPYFSNDYINLWRDQINFAMDNEPIVISNGFYEGIEYISTNEEMIAAFQYLSNCEKVAIDLETLGLRPYATDSKILSMALSDGKRTFAFPLWHKQAPSELDPNIILLNLYQLVAKVPLIAHNLAFEEEWLGYFMEEIFNDQYKFLFLNTHHDTQAQAHILSKDNKQQLNHCIRRVFGFPLKDLSGIDVADLDNYPLEEVLKYNALDAKWTFKLWEKQAIEIARQQLEDSYQRQIERIPAVVIMQLLGVLPDLDFVYSQEGEPIRQRAELLTKFFEYPEVKKVVERYPRFLEKPFSNPALKLLFYDELGVNPEVVTSLDEKFLKSFNHEIANTLLELRKTNKFLSTYILPFDNRSKVKKRSLWDDSLIHTSFNTLVTVTFRLSSSGPNLQNFPSRDGKEYLRNVVKAPRGKVIVAIDYTAIEAVIAACLSNDQTLIQEIIDGTDMHAVWTLKLMEAFPKKWGNPNDPDAFKKFRKIVKNSMVFPSLYGCGYKKVAQAFKLLETEYSRLYGIIKQFWEKYHAIKSWQQEMVSFYKEHGYVESVFGRKFWAHLGFNDIVNYPIQSCASDIVVCAMTKLAQLGIETENFDIIPRINVHDDLTFYVDETKIDECLQIVLPIMLDTIPYKKWLKIPLTVKVSMGQSWGNLQDFGTFTSNDIEKIKST